MKFTKMIAKRLFCGVLAGAMVVAGITVAHSPSEMAVKADTVNTSIELVNEITEKRERFVKEFIMSDGSFTAVTYSMPIHYETKQGWEEIDTSIIQSGKKKYYKTKATDLSINVSKKLNQKSVISLKRGSASLSWALKNKKIKSVKAQINNPEKTNTFDVLNRSQVMYTKGMKNTDITYDIYPEKVQEVIAINKKQDIKKLCFQVNSGKLKVKVKGMRVYFKNKKGETKYTRMRTVLSDAKGVSTNSIKVFYNKKKGILTLTPPKKWWKDKKRKFPMEIRTTYTTDQHDRDVKVGAAYTGAPNGRFGYDKSLLVQANKCVAFTRMTSLAELSQPNVQIRGAALHLMNEQTLKLGAGKTFDIGVHKVKEDWSAMKLTYNNRPSYESNASATFTIQNAGEYQCDVTDIVKSWYAGEANYGVALVADNSNGTYQAELDRNPFFTVHYEVVGLDGAVELKENQEITRDVLNSGQENYYFFDTQPGVAYELYTSSSLDTQGILYDSEKNRLGYDDDSGMQNNFAFIQSYDGRRYLKVRAKGMDTGKYTLTLKKRFEIPEPIGKQGQDSYTISWNPVNNAKEYMITIYDSNGKIGEKLVSGTSYEYIFTEETAGKTLAFTVTPRESQSLVGEPSRKIFTGNHSSKWNYDVPMPQGRCNFASAVWGDSIYVLGGENKEKSTVFKDLMVFDTEKKKWTKISEYPGDVTGICNASMVNVKGKLYILGGQTDTSATAKLLKEVYCYEPETNQWTKAADMPVARTQTPTTVCDGRIYVFAKAGSTERVDIYNPAEDAWTQDVKADTCINLQAHTVDGRIFVLREKEDQMYFEEYLPETGEYDNAGEFCTVAGADYYLSGTVVNGKIYLMNNGETNQVLCYDVYLDQWSKLSVLNLKKEASQLQAVGNTLYNLGGFLQGFGSLDVVEYHELETKQIVKQLQVTKGESYELQVNAGNCQEDTDYFITVRIDPAVLEYSKTSSFMQKEELAEGKDGIQLVRYAPEKGVMVLKLSSKMETGDTFQAYQSVPVTGLIEESTIVRMDIEKEK